MEDQNQHKNQPQKPKNETPAAGPNQQNEGQAWDKVDSLFTVARNTFFQGNSTFLEILDSLIATLQDMRENEVRPLGGLGTQKQKMKLEESVPPEEKVPANPNI